MDILREAANTYQEFLDHEYTFVFGDKKRNQYIIRLVSKAEHFPHLIGLDKLTYIRSSIYSNSTKSEVHGKVLNQGITERDVEKSTKYVNDDFHLSIKERVLHFQFIQGLIQEGMNIQEASFKFIKGYAYSNIDADVLMRLKISLDGKVIFLNLFLKKDNRSDSEFYVPISFFPRLDNTYEKGQPKLTLLHKIKHSPTGDIELYRHPKYYYEE